MAGFNKELEKRYFVNEQIRAAKVLLLDEEWQKLGVFPLQQALDMWQQQTLDVVQIWFNPTENIATAKLVDYWKFMYLSRKQDKEKKKTQKVWWIKEIKFWYNIWENDLSIKINKSQEFLEEWYSVKFIWVLRWREFVYKAKMYENLESIAKSLEWFGKSQWIKEERNWYSMILFSKWK